MLHEAGQESLKIVVTPPSHAKAVGKEVVQRFDVLARNAKPSLRLVCVLTTGDTLTASSRWQVERPVLFRLRFGDLAEREKTV